MTNATKGKCIKATAIGIDVLVPLMATLSQFPIWVDRSAGATMSGITVLLAILSAVPLFKWVKKHIETPSAWMMWLVLFGVLLAVSAIIDEMVVVAGWGALANAVGAGIFKWGEKVEGTGE